MLNKWRGGGEGDGDNNFLLWKREAYSRRGYMREKSLFKSGGGLIERGVNRGFTVIVLFLAG